MIDANKDKQYERDQEKAKLWDKFKTDNKD